MRLLILFVGGGSAGHIAPSVAVWRTINAEHPDIRAHFVCSCRQTDLLFLEGEHLPYTITPSPRVGWTFPFLFWKSLFHAFFILHEHKPQLIFSTGGYVGIPLCIAAWTQGIPIILHESDAVMGRANRLIAKIAKYVHYGFPTGNPVRPHITQGSKEKGFHITGFSGKRPILLVWGGSQGAQAMNEVIVKMLPDLTKLCDIIHITGPGKNHSPRTSSYWSTEFATSALPHLFAIAELAVSRSAASSIAELAANGIPALLVPLRGLAQDHQLQNAKLAAMSGGCILLHQDDLEHELCPLVNSLLQNPDRLQEMRASMQTLSASDASGLICKIIFQYI